MTPVAEKLNILLVDDQPAKLLSYEVMLAEMGENLIKASSAREALEQLLKHESTSACPSRTDSNWPQ
jgi:CheY-like chemotaxis protein